MYYRPNELRVQRFRQNRNQPDYSQIFDKMWGEWIQGSDPKQLKLLSPAKLKDQFVMHLIRTGHNISQNALLALAEIATHHIEVLCIQTNTIQETKVATDKQ